MGVIGEMGEMGEMEQKRTQSGQRAAEQREGVYPYYIKDEASLVNHIYRCHYIGQQPRDALLFRST